MKSYLNVFKQLQEKCKDAYKLYGDCILVEEVEKEEFKTAGGIVIAQSINSRVLDSIEDNRPQLVRALLIGEGFIGEDGEDVKVDVNQGDILLTGKLSIKWLSAFGPILMQEGSARIGLMRETDIQMKFIGQEGYDKVGLTLNSLLKERS